MQQIKPEQNNLTISCVDTRWYSEDDSIIILIVIIVIIFEGIMIAILSMNTTHFEIWFGRLI